MTLIKTIVILSAFLTGGVLSAQTNVFPNTGNVGIGTTTPSIPLDIRGSESGWFGARVRNDATTSAAKSYFQVEGAGSYRLALIHTSPTHTTSGIFAPDAGLLSADGPGGLRIASANGSLTFWTSNPETERLRITTAGNAGVGTTAPQARLHISSTGDGTQAIFNAPWTANEQQVLFKTGWNSNDAISGFAAIGWKDTESAGGAFWISTLQTGSVGTTAPTKRLYIDHSGNVGIGTTNPTQKLAVNGTVLAKEIVVQSTGWADYVFADDYELKPLAEIEAHIKERKHLPGIPSAAEVAQQGVSVGEMQAKLLAKLEEVTLHLIAQEKAIHSLQRENAELRAKVEGMEGEP